MSMGQGWIAEMDAEWVELMLTARRLGISKEEVRDFLNRTSSGPDNTQALMLAGSITLTMQGITE